MVYLGEGATSSSVLVTTTSSEASPEKGNRTFGESLVLFGAFALRLPVGLGLRQPLLLAWKMLIVDFWSSVRERGC